MKRETKRKVGAAPGFLSECAIFHDGGYKTNKITKSFSKKKQENEFIWVKLFNILNFCNITFIVFRIKDVHKSVPYYQ